MRILRLGQSLCSSNGGLGSSDFKFVIKTSTPGATTSTQFQLPLVSSGAISMDVDWGDGTTDTITTYNQAETLHTYSVAGKYNIKISNEVRGWQFNNGGDKAKFDRVVNCGELNITKKAAFYGCLNMQWVAVDTPTITTANLNDTFRDCTDFNGDISNWNIESVTSLDAMLRGATSFDQNISKWNIKNVTSMVNFMQNAGISTPNYNALLVGWQTQGPNTGLTTNFGSSRYYAAPNAAGLAHDSLTAAIPTGYGWTITDGGTA